MKTRAKEKAKLKPDFGSLCRFQRAQTEDAKLQLPKEQPDLEALHAITREWLAPRLAEEFLRERSLERRSSSSPCAAFERQRSFPGKTVTRTGIEATVTTRPNASK